MSHRVILTETAKRDLREIAFYIAEQSKDKEIARQFVNELREKCSRLEEFPQAGALPKDHVLRSLEYRFISHKEYLIFYSVDEKEQAVNVLAIFNAVYRVRRYAGFVYHSFTEMFSDKPDNISMEKAAAGENWERTLNFIRYI